MTARMVETRLRREQQRWKTQHPAKFGFLLSLQVEVKRWMPSSGSIRRGAWSRQLKEVKTGSRKRPDPNPKLSFVFNAIHSVGSKRWVISSWRVICRGRSTRFTGTTGATGALGCQKCQVLVKTRGASRYKQHTLHGRGLRWKKIEIITLITLL